MWGEASYLELQTVLEDEVLTVTLSRPEKLNAYTLTMGRELRDVFDKASADDDVRAIIVTGAGRAFCAGADISGGGDSFAAGAAARAAAPETRVENRFVDAIFNCAKPSVAAINGAAVGVGITMTLPMDIRIAARDARIGFVFARRGLVLEAGCAWYLPRIVGLPQALRWCYEARLLAADEALDGGLVGEIVEPADLLTRARAIARGLIDGVAPVSIALTRRLLYRAMGEATPIPILELDAQLNRELGVRPDVREGVRAFLEKRPPRFPGRTSADLPPTAARL
jgi:enoyl-CoA hydratase/carnithine racemase